MPMPILQWCNMVQRSFQDIFKNQDKSQNQGLNYLTAIQLLREKTPGLKHAELNGLINIAINNIKRKNGVIEPEHFRGIPVGLVPLARVIVADKLKKPELIIEALQSEDRYVNSRALAARWFFDGRNDWIQAHEFTRQVMPNAPLKVRRSIAKQLSRSLVGHADKAEAFFDCFADAYGYKLGVPILLACTDDFVYQKVLEQKIVFSERMMIRLYAQRPDLAVKYLQLANWRSKANEADRKLVEVRIFNYGNLLPKMIKKHPHVFVQLYDLTPDKWMQLSRTKSEQFLKNLKDVLVERPRVYLKLLPLEMVSKNMNREEFEKMYRNLFPEDKEEFDLDDALGYLRHYTHGDKYELLKSKYKSAYGSDFPTEKFLESTIDTTSMKLAKIIPAEELVVLGEKLLDKHKDNSELCKIFMSYLTPDKVLVALKNSIKAMNAQSDRELAFNSMITSCYLHQDPQRLHEIFEYYYAVHKNEGAHFLWSVFGRISELGCNELFDDRHWKVAMDIIRYTNARGDLFSLDRSQTEWIFKTALRYYLSVDETDASKEMINEIVGLLLMLKVEQCLSGWNVLRDDPKLERTGLEKLLEATPFKYPESHAVWQEPNKAVCVALEIVKTIIKYNERKWPMTKKMKRDASAWRINENERLRIEKYPWLVSLIERTLSNASPQSFRKRKLRELLEKSFPAFLESRVRVPQSNEIHDVESGRALKLLRRNPQKILENWEAYLGKAATALSHGGSHGRAARRFVAATRWYHEIPIRFVDRSLTYAAARVRGYVIVLGILLDGETMAKIVVEDESDEKLNEKFARAKEILEALKYAEPPVDLEQLLRFRSSDFVRETESTLMSLSNRVGAERMANFARQWSESRMITVKKQGIRLYQKTATVDEVLKFLKDLYLSEDNPGLKLLVTKIILEIFVDSPSPRTWALVEDSMRNLTADNLVNLASVFTNLRTIHRDYLSEYVSLFLDTTEALAKSDLSQSARANAVSALIENLDPARASFLSQPVTMKILDRYFFDLSSSDVSRVGQRFAIVSYLLPTEENFEERLQTIVGKLKAIAKEYNTPHSKNPRFYPAKEALQSFCERLTTELEQDHPVEKKLFAIDSFLEAFETSLEPHAALSARMRLNFYSEYLRSGSAQEFGNRCLKSAREYVDKWSDLVVHDIGYCMKKLLGEKHKLNDYRLDLIEGLIREENRVGCLIGIVLLENMNLAGHEKKYDQLISTLSNVKDSTVQAYFDMHLSNIDIAMVTSSKCPHCDWITINN